MAGVADVTDGQKSEMCVQTQGSQTESYTPSDQDPRFRSQTDTRTSTEHFSLHPIILESRELEVDSNRSFYRKSGNR